MALFMCRKCKHVDNNDLCTDQGDYPTLCTMCNKGKWHGRFRQRHANGMYIDAVGILWDPILVNTHSNNRKHKLIGVINEVGDVVPLPPLKERFKNREMAFY